MRHANLARTRLPLALLVAMGALLSLLASACDEPEEDAGRRCEPAPGAICTVVGTGESGLTPDNLPALATELYLPQDLTFGPDGRPYILDWNNHRVRVVDEAGRVQTLIGTGSLGDAPNGRAREVSLNHPTHIAFSPDGAIILSAWHNSKVLRYDFDTDSVQAICGTGARSFNGDGLTGVETFLDLPVATAYRPDGTLLISDQANQRIRALSPDGMVTTVVGNGMQGYSGDGGLATEASLNLPTSQSAPPAGRIATDAEGVLYIADTSNHVVRRVDLDGTITTIAGTGTRGNGAATGLATETALDTPSDVDIDAHGNVYIADTMNSCIRRVSPDGQISTAAGVCGQPGYAGDGEGAASALLDRPYGIAFSADGDLYIADTHNHVVRVVYAP